MDVKEAIKAIGDKIEKNADYYSKTLKNDSIIKIEEVVKDCVITVWIEKRKPFNIGTSVVVNVPAICGCSRVSVRNIGDADVEVLSANIIFNRSGVMR